MSVKKGRTTVRINNHLTFYLCIRSLIKTFVIMVFSIQGFANASATNRYNDVIERSSTFDHSYFFLFGFFFLIPFWSEWFANKSHNRRQKSSDVCKSRSHEWDWNLEQHDRHITNDFLWNSQRERETWKKRTHERAHWFGSLIFIEAKSSIMSAISFCCNFIFITTTVHSALPGQSTSSVP